MSRDAAEIEVEVIEPDVTFRIMFLPWHEWQCCLRNGVILIQCLDLPRLIELIGRHANNTSRTNHAKFGSRKPVL